MRHPAIEDHLLVHRLRVLLQGSKGPTPAFRDPGTKTGHQSIGIGFQKIFTCWSTILPGLGSWKNTTKGAAGNLKDAIGLQNDWGAGIVACLSKKQDWWWGEQSWSDYAGMVCFKQSKLKCQQSTPFITKRKITRQLVRTSQVHSATSCNALTKSLWHSGLA